MCPDSNPDTNPNATEDDRNTPTDAPTRTLTVRVGDAERTRREARERIAAAERGDDLDARHVLNFEDEADLARLVSQTNLELLRAIADHEPRSMREVEQIVERDHKEVHRNLQELAAMGVVELAEEGRAKRPVVRFDELQITVPIGRDDPERATDAKSAVADHDS
ncbi:HVO_A0114 family putative DNA-binding protein [Halorussus amylolyticus]|uniref:HVO_A0114 family putative DNA-binding protein n=1 Tax=Halorussus amylolyticus TaxID=1126242 RepID=UPI001EE46881|nr:hypothetical protein [Halorussus amylolyticus]